MHINGQEYELVSIHDRITEITTDFGDDYVYIVAKQVERYPHYSAGWMPSKGNEEQIAYILREMKNPARTAAEEIEDLIAQGLWVAAVKAVRIEFNCGLLEAKLAVDKLRGL